MSWLRRAREVKPTYVPDRNDNLLRVLRKQRDDGWNLARESTGRANVAERERDRWKARAEHLASEKAEADMRYADARYLLEGMARKLVATRKNYREAAQRQVRTMAETINGGRPGVTVGTRWLPLVGDRVTGESATDLPGLRTGVLEGYMHGVKYEHMARIKDDRDGRPSFVHRDSLRPAPCDDVQDGAGR